MLERHAKDADVAAINKAGALIAREAFGEKEGYVLGDIGPFGGLLEPYGEVAEKSVREAFAEQARALVDGGADAIIIETQTSLEELGIGLEAAREAGAPCVIGSMAYDVTFDGEEIRTMMGIGPEDAAEFMAENGADVIALNCGSGIDVSWAARAVERYRRITDLPTMAQPNAGLPELVDMEVVYRQTPEEMTGELSALLNAGANIVGGCCGSSPDHLRLFRKLFDETQDGKPEVAS